MNIADRASIALGLASVLAVAAAAGYATRRDPPAHSPAVVRVEAAPPAPLPVPEPSEQVPGPQVLPSPTPEPRELPTHCMAEPETTVPDHAAKLASHDPDFAQFLAIPFPTGLDFGPDEPEAQNASFERLNAWLTSKTALATKLNARYGQIVEHGTPVEAITATANLGLVAASFAYALNTAEIPADVRSGDYAEDKVDAYCDALTTAAEPLYDRAVKMLTTCVEQARRFARKRAAVDVSGVLTAAEPCLDALEVFRSEEQRLEEEFIAPDATRQQIRFGVTNAADAGTDYDGENTRGVALRTQGKLAKAHAAYARAIALDPTRPEAYYNDALAFLLDGEGGATTAKTLAMWDRAIARFYEASERAEGTLQERATEHAQRATRLLDEVRRLETTPDD